MADTLAPLQVLLLGVVRNLEAEVLPHVAGEPFTAVMENCELLRMIIGTLGADEVPAYCEVASCQNVRARGADLCIRHLIEVALERGVLVVGERP